MGTDIPRNEYLGFFLFLVMSTIVWAATTNTSYVVLTFGRSGLIVLLMVIAVMGLIIRRPMAMKAHTVVALFMLLLFYLYGLLLSALNRNVPVIGFSAFMGAVLTALFIYLEGERGRGVFPDSYLYAYIYMAVAIGFLSYMLGGIVIDGVPKFVFGSDLSKNQVDLNYSQAVSKFYGLSAIISTHLFFARESKSKLASFFLSFITVTFILLSALAGGRGDFIAALVVIGLILYIKGKWSFLFAVVVVLVLLLTADWDVLAFDFSIVKRMQLLNSSLGMRDVLALNVIELLSNEYSCLVFGCGFGYFQEYFGYSEDLYPHNVVLELMVVIGLPLTVMLLSLACLGVVRNWQRVLQHDALSWVLIFFFLISLKSGSIYSSWFSVGAIFFFSSIAFRRGVSLERP